MLVLRFLWDFVGGVLVLCTFISSRLRFAESEISEKRDYLGICGNFLGIYFNGIMDYFFSNLFYFEFFK